jgi:hypothetical protein
MVRKLIIPVLGLAVAGIYIGCSRFEPGPSPAPATTAATPTVTTPDGDHHDKPGSHGGLIVSLGADNYHAEAVFEQGGKLRLHILGKDEARVQEVERQEITANVKLENEVESTQVVLKPEPQPGDGEGKTSQFIGQLPRRFQGKSVVVTFAIRINGERFRRNFASASAAHDDGMPVALSAAEEENLYLTPGGKYTEADIKANGNMTASEKFKGLRSSHNARTKEGDKICPISETKANPQFLWIVGGKAYQFCCPPCVDEFVKLAKEQPEQIKEPEQYVKK